MTQDEDAPVQQQRTEPQGGQMEAELERLVAEVVRVAREVGIEGKLGGQAEVPGVSGVWRQLTDSVNSMASNVSAQARHISEVTKAVARGDLSRKVTVEAHGEILELKSTINTMIDQLDAFSSEVMRVAHEVGSEGKLDAQARVPGVAGIWKELTESFNSMIVNLRLSTERSAEAALRTEALLAQSQQLAAELALASRYKSEFLANMSHELRTPLSSILILGQQLADNPAQNLTPRQVEQARTIHGAGVDLLTLITDILDHSKIESGTVAIEPAELGFAALLDAVAPSFRHDAERRGLAFDVSLDSRLGPTLVVDPKRLQQVLRNLLANALKFTAAGGVRLAVFPAAAGWTREHAALARAGAVVAFEVSDTGIGIAPEKQRIIFEAFQQADAGTSRKYGGTGLGLAISRELATLLGGEIQLRSTPGVGSTFTLYLPLGHAKESAVAAAGGSRVEAIAAPGLRDGRQPERTAARLADGLEGRKLLVVDDDVRNLFVLGSVVEQRGMVMVTAQNGREALRLLERDPDIAAVLMDIMMPELDGYQTIQLIRQQPSKQQLPIIALTAKAMKGDREKCLDAGASDYLAKPVSAELLLETLRTWLNR